MKNLIFVFLFVLTPFANATFYGIPPDEFKEFYAPQKEQNWCWAASSAMVIRYQGVKLDQVDIVMRIKGGLPDAPAVPMEIVAGVNSVFNSTIDGKPSRVVTSGQYVLGAPLPTILFNQISQKKPVILTYAAPFPGGIGHAVVITGINAYFTPSGVMVDKIFVFDPFAYHPPTTGFLFRPDLVYREYSLMMIGPHLTIPPGNITGVILMNSSVIPI